MDEIQRELALYETRIQVQNNLNTRATKINQIRLDRESKVGGFNG
jgi:hypothetical protein